MIPGLILALFCSLVMAAPEPRPAPDKADLANATYHGMVDAGGAITLVDGEWRGEPFVQDGASVPAANMIGDLVAQGDPNDDGRMESANLISYSGGGTGQFVHLAVSRLSQDMVENFATVLLGDRVMIRNLCISSELILVGVVEPGPDDSACCPGDVVTRKFRLDGDRLEEVRGDEAGRLSEQTLAGVEWRLSRWSFDEASKAGPPITLQYAQGRFTGRSVCNHYFADVISGEGGPGSLVVSGVGSTRMACIDESLSLDEERFLTALGQVNRLSFESGELVLSWGQGSNSGALYFTPSDARCE